MGQSPRSWTFFCHLNNYFEIGGFIIDFWPGKFSPLLAEMMLEYIDYTMTQPMTEYWRARGARPRSPIYSNVWGKHAPCPCFTCINGTGASQLTQFRMKWRQRPILKLRCHSFLQTQMYGCSLYHMITMDSTLRHWRYSKWNGVVDTLMKQGCPYIQQN